MKRNHSNGATLPMAPATLINPRPAQPLMHIDPAQFEADFEPGGDLVLVRMLKQKETAGGLHLPNGASDGTPKRAQVVKVGPGAMNLRKADGSRIPMDPEVKPGKVIYPLFQGQGVPIHVGEHTYFVINVNQIVGFSSAPPESL